MLFFGYPAGEAIRGRTGASMKKKFLLAGVGMEDGGGEALAGSKPPSWKVFC